jgi:hypothetical protein
MVLLCVCVSTEEDKWLEDLFRERFRGFFKVVISNGRLLTKSVPVYVSRDVNCKNDISELRTDI